MQASVFTPTTRRSPCALGELEILDVAQMNQVEAAVGEDDFLPMER
jgi:hypothetical protein